MRDELRGEKDTCTEGEGEKMGPKRWSARREGQVQVRKGDEGEKEVVEDE